MKKSFLVSKLSIKPWAGKTSKCKQDNKTGNTELPNIIWRVPHGSILGPLLFITYVNDLFLKPVRFADDTNLFCKSKTVKTLFIPGLKKFRNGFKQTNYL